MNKINIDGILYHVKPWTLRERRQFLQAHKQYPDDESGLQCLLVILSVCNEDGSKMFSNDDLEVLLDYPAVVIDKLVQEIMCVNKLNTNPVDDAKNA